MSNPTQLSSWGYVEVEMGVWQHDTVKDKVIGCWNLKNTAWWLYIFKLLIEIVGVFG